MAYSRHKGVLIGLYKVWERLSWLCLIWVLTERPHFAAFGSG